MAGLLSLKWNNHSTAFLQSIGKIHLKEKYCDATIVCQGQYFPVHRIVLSSCSLYFDEIFEMIKTQHPIIVFKDIDPREMKLMLNYMYKGEINVDQEMLPILLKAAEALKIRGIAVPDDFPSPKPSSDRKRNNTMSSSSNPKRKMEDWNKTNASKSSSPNRASNYNTYSDMDNSYSLEDTVKLNPARENCEDKKATTTHIKEEPVEVLDYDVNEMASTYSTLSCEPTKENFDMYAHLPEKSEPSFVTPEDLPSAEEVGDNRLPRLNNFNDANSISNISSHDGIGEEDDNNPGPNPQAVAIELKSNILADIKCRSTDEARTEFGPSSSERLEIDPQTYFENQRLLHDDAHIAKPFHCHICGKYFALKQHLQNHMHIHTGIKNFACVKCSKRFALKQHLQIHLRVHTGEKPYICRACPKRFRQKSHLNSHMACVHNS